MTSKQHYTLWLVFCIGGIILIVADMVYLNHEYGHINQWSIATASGFGSVWNYCKAVTK